MLPQAACVQQRSHNTGRVLGQAWWSGQLVQAVGKFAAGDGQVQLQYTYWNPIGIEQYY